VEEIYKNISITIVLYQENINTISKCLEKLINFKIIIIDNAGDYKLKKIINDRFNINKYVVNKKNVGFSKAANQAIKLCSTDFILNIEADCVIEAKDIFILFNSLKKYDNCFMVTPTFYDEKSNLSYNGGPLPEKNIPMEVLNLKGNTCIETPLTAAILFKKQDFIDIGLFDEDLFIYFPDFELGRRLNKIKKPIIQIFEAKALHTMGNLKIKNNSKKIIFRNYYFTLDELMYYFKTNNHQKKYFELKKKIPSLFFKGILNLILFNFNKFLKCFSRILAFYQFNKKIK